MFIKGDMYEKVMKETIAKRITYDARLLWPREFLVKKYKKVVRQRKDVRVKDAVVKTEKMTE